MPKRILRPKKLSYLPLPEYPYSAGTSANGLIYSAGLVAWDEQGKIVGKGDVRRQTRQIFANLKAVLAEAGAGFEDILKCNVYLADMRYFSQMNEEFRAAFPKDPPARTTVQAALAEPEMLVEIEAVAFIGKL
ncbi:MAG TPA: RidA family protein [Aestuariivirgaceae bacterium]|jgi:2-iminobutanoate/2-iminopropanoate deaminase|nr:RidA family protein [Aestuariivirgaceae bacterium]